MLLYSIPCVEFDFKVSDHVEIGERYDLIDFKYVRDCSIEQAVCIVMHSVIYFMVLAVH